jgi:23S rRNA pseudouridine2457 synthase
MLIGFNKPYGVLSQFSLDTSPHQTLAGFSFPPRVYPIGRLDAESEGLLLLSDEPELNQRLLHPTQGHLRCYWAQVERTPVEQDLARLEAGLNIQGRKTLPCRARILSPQPEVAPRNPPIRFRKLIETCWVEIELVEGKNRQVRRMTAAIGHPTLRLIRIRIGKFLLGNLASGTWRILTAPERELVFQ